MGFEYQVVDANVQDSEYQVADVSLMGFEYHVADGNVQGSVYQVVDATNRLAAAKLEAEFEAKTAAQVQLKMLEVQKAKKDKECMAGRVSELVKQHAADVARFEMKLRVVGAAGRVAAAKATKARPDTDN